MTPSAVRPSGRIVLRAAGLALAGSVLAGCNIVDRLEQVGSPPPLSPIENPMAESGYEPVILPMPPQQAVALLPNSLWQPGARQFFKDQRAAKIGDILTVLIEVKDSADIKNSTERTRTMNEDDSASALIGYETHLDAFLPEAIDPTNLIDIKSQSAHTGEGTIDRTEEIKLKVAAVVTQTLPNGNLVIQGRQEIRVNFEKREVLVAGVVRPEDITAENTIDAEKIAEARIAYGGQGQLTDVQQPRYGSQVIDILYPF